MTTRKFSFRGPAEAQAPLKVIAVLRCLWDGHVLPEAKDAFQPIDALVLNSHSLTPEFREMTAAWDKDYLLSENPSLVPFVLRTWIYFAELRTNPLYRVDMGQESIVRDPTVLPRPTDREGRERYAAALDRHRDAGDTTTDGWRAWKHAEAWIKVRHGQTRLADHVKAVGIRRYTKSDGERRLNDNAYKRWWRNLKAVDAAIEAIIPIHSSSN